MAKKAALKSHKTRAKSSGVRRRARADEETENLCPGLTFPVVAIGASAGGLAAFTELPTALSSKSGMAFVLIQHQEPKHESALTALLSKTTSMPVVEVSEGMAVEPNRVYVIPPNKAMTIPKGTLRLARRSAPSGLQRPIDDFSIALAEDLTNDLSNLLVGVDIPVLVLDAGHHARRFTPVAGALLNLVSGDVGRPFSDIAPSLDVANWEELFSEVTGHGRLIEREVRDRKGHRYSLRARPYKTNDKKIEGVLVVLLDVDLIYRARDEAKQAGDYARAIVETIHEALAVVDSGFRVLTVNRSFCELFNVSLQGTESQSLFELSKGQWNVPRLRELLQDILQNGTEIKDFEVHQEFAEIGRRYLVLNARQIDTSGTILIAIEDVTQRRQAQEESERSDSTIRSLLESAPQSVVAVNADEKIVLANGNTETMFGYRLEELLGQRLDILIPENLRARHVEHHNAYFANKQSRPTGIGLNLEARRKDGTLFPVEIGLSAVETAAGKLGVAFVSDITQRRKMEQAAQRQAQEVQALAANLLTAQEEERRRVSREIHDQICQQLASMAIDLTPSPTLDAQESHPTSLIG